jgi:hypothetical protein
MPKTVDIDAYFERIAWRGSRDPTLETLSGSIEAHPSIVTELSDRTALRRLPVEHFGFDLPQVERLTVPAIPE